MPVSGFRIYYNPVDVPNLSLWTVRDVGLYSMTVIGGLNPAVKYAVRMQSRDGDGNVGPITKAYILPDYIKPGNRCMKSDLPYFVVICFILMLPIYLVLYSDAFQNKIYNYFKDMSCS